MKKLGKDVESFFRKYLGSKMTKAKEVYEEMLQDLYSWVERDDGVEVDGKWVKVG